MKPETIQLLRDPKIAPTNEVITQALGPANAAFNQFINTLTNYKIDVAWNYYPDGKAWLAKGIYQWQGKRGGNKKMTVFWLAIYADFFRVTIFFPEKTRTDLLNLALEKSVMDVIIDTSQMGKLKFFPITFDLKSEEQFSTIFKLFAWKISLE